MQGVAEILTLYPFVAFAALLTARYVLYFISRNIILSFLYIEKFPGVIPGPHGSRSSYDNDYLLGWYWLAVTMDLVSVDMSCPVHSFDQFVGGMDRIRLHVSSAGTSGGISATITNDRIWRLNRSPLPGNGLFLDAGELHLSLPNLLEFFLMVITFQVPSEGPYFAKSKYPYVLLYAEKVVGLTQTLSQQRISWENRSLGQLAK